MFYKVIKKEKLDPNSEDRFIIVDEFNNILDDAQGYGYRSEYNAHRAYTHKLNPKRINNLFEIKEWKHKNHYLFDRLADYIAEFCYYEYKSGKKRVEIKINLNDFVELCKQIGIEDTSFANKFTYEDLLKYFFK